MTKEQLIGITNNLSTETIQALAKQPMYEPLFQPIGQVRQFISHVARGEYQQVTGMLQKQIELVFQKEQVTDYSNRTFKRVSGFQYALWADIPPCDAATFKIFL
ncbi:MAG: hypothetical protein WC785_05910 [Tatlockia sp.]